MIFATESDLEEWCLENDIIEYSYYFTSQGVVLLM